MKRLGILLLAAACTSPMTSTQPDGEAEKVVESVASPSPSTAAPRTTKTVVDSPPSPRASRAARSRPVDVGRERATTLDWNALARCESTNNPRAVSPDGRYFGAYQFDLSTWRSVGGSGNPADASLAEQTARAQKLYDARGSQPWPRCGRWLR